MAPGTTLKALRLEGHHLVFPTQLERMPRVGSLLEPFMRLADAEDNAVLAFARRYGRLGICRHGGILGHQVPHPFQAPSHVCSETSNCGEHHRGLSEPDSDTLAAFQRFGKERPPKGVIVLLESVDAWRYFARKVRAVVRLATRIREGQARKFSALNEDESRYLFIDDRSGGLFAGLELDDPARLLDSYEHGFSLNALLKGPLEGVACSRYSLSPRRQRLLRSLRQGDLDGELVSETIVEHIVNELDLAKQDPASFALELVAPGKR